VIPGTGAKADMASAQQMVRGVVKIEDSTSPEAIFIPTEPVPVVDNTTPPVIRCQSVIGKKPERSCHPTFLPTCRTHRDQESFAGWCQYQHAGGEKCGRLFRWTRPYLEICTEHQGHSDTPCYFFNLPVELRHEVFRYLLPDRAIGNSTAPLHDENEDIFNPNIVLGAQRYGPRSLLHNTLSHVLMEHRYAETVFPMPALDLFLVNRQFYDEVKDLLFSTVPFTIDVRRDGTFMCGRRLLEPRRADGSAHFMLHETDEAKQRFLRYFDWAAVKHYNVDILVENATSRSTYPKNSTWDEEVELYDIRGASYVIIVSIVSEMKERNERNENILTMQQTTSPSSSPASSPNPTASANSKSSSASQTLRGPRPSSSPTRASSQGPLNPCATSAPRNSSASQQGGPTTTRCSPSRGPRTAATALASAACRACPRTRCCWPRAPPPSIPTPPAGRAGSRRARPRT
jgi:hypothetical protein